MNWKKAATQALVGKRISSVEWMTKKDAEENGFHKRPLVITFDDGSWMFPMMDDEGNDGGSLASTGFKTQEGLIDTWPVM